MALCKNHHWAFDRGLITLSADLRVRVSPTLDESAPAEWMLMQFDGVRARVPGDERMVPAKQVTKWHRENVSWDA